MPDILLRGEWSQLQIRVMVLEATQVCKTIGDFHHTSGLAGRVFFQCMAAGLLTSPLLVEDERFTLRWQYAGELGTLTVDIAADGGLRAYPECLGLSDETAESAFGAGGKLGLVKSNPYRRLNSGMTLADQADPALDLATYFELSDQLPTICIARVQVPRVIGLMFQAMPKADREHFEHLRTWVTQAIDELLALKKIEPAGVSVWLSQGLQAANLPAEPWKLHQTLTPHHFCNCSVDKVHDMLRGLPVSELEAMIREDGGAQVDCQFCAHTIRFEASDLQNIIKSKA